MAIISGPFIIRLTPDKVPLRQNSEALDGRREEELKERVDFGHSGSGKTCKKGRNTGGGKEGKQ